MDTYSTNKLDELLWKESTARALRWAQELKPTAIKMAQALDNMDLPLDQLEGIYFYPEQSRYTAIVKQAADLSTWDVLKECGFDVTTKEARTYDVYVDADDLNLCVVPGLSKIAKLTDPYLYADTVHCIGEYLKEAGLDDIGERFIKLASPMASPAPGTSGPGGSPTMTALGELSGYLPGGHMSWTIPGVPRGLAGMVGGGLIGAGLGYGAGWLGSRIMPRKWDRSRLPKTMAIMGGMMGAAPGLIGGLSNKAQGKGFFDDGLFNVAPYPQEFSNNAVDQPVYSTGPAQSGQPLAPAQGNKLASELIETEYQQGCNHFDDTFGINLHPHLTQSIKLAFDPSYSNGSGWDTDLSSTPIDIDDMNYSLWNDSRVTHSLPLPLRAATSAVLESAYESKGGGPRFITPHDVANIAVGMGSGYMSGRLVGVVLGALTGMPQETKDTLKQTGMYAGAILNTVPLLFRN
jgi:hypothetical protein